MKIVVAVEQVPDIGDDISLAADRRSILTEGADWDLSYRDLCAVEAALELREAAGGGEVVVVSVSEPEARGGVLTALALGADRAVVVADDALAELDDLAVGRVLSSVVEREAPDLVLFGRMEAAGVALAAFLGLPRVTSVRRVDHEPGRAIATVERALPGGRAERIEVPTPALITVAADAYRPRYATLSGIRLAWRKPFEILTLEETSTGADALDAVRGARVRALARPPRPSGAEMIEGSPDEIAERIADIIKSRVS
ncbi:MAG TPA: electron transfer flavoprotein subunit beta/FixA family protein [Solirubrobacteraceae bacterium]|nr:electron transfer flavoprotein subunit beta/FixA family protein [Solirubrobacteraceae bacterium]